MLMPSVSVKDVLDGSLFRYGRISSFHNASFRRVARYEERTEEHLIVEGPIQSLKCT